MQFTMKRLRDYALGAIVVLNVIATVVSFGESYSGLYQWAVEHQITGLWGAVWPLMVDVIVLVAEAGLFVAHYDKWAMRHKAWLWSVMSTALAVSVGGNTGHIKSTDWLTHLTAALPPMALAFAMSVGFGVMKRTFMHKPETSETVSQPAVSAVSPVVSIDVAHTPETPRLTETPAETPRPEAVSPPAETETTIMNETETPAETPDPRISETLLNMGYKATDKSFTMPRDPREGLSLPERRVRDMYDVDPDITGGKIEQALGISRATAYRYLSSTKKARGLAE